MSDAPAGPRQDNAKLTEELLAFADELDWQAGVLRGAWGEDDLGTGRSSLTCEREAALIRALVAEHDRARDAADDGNLLNNRAADESRARAHAVWRQTERTLGLLAD